jgi:hypothetical protein
MDTSYPSSMRGNGSTPSPSPVTEPLSESWPAVGDWVLLLSEDGVVQNAKPYLVTAIEQGPDGHWYARFPTHAGGWPLDRCEKTAPPPPSEAFDALYEGMLGAQEEAQMRTFFSPPAQAPDGAPVVAPESSAPGLPLKDPPPGQACPKCGRNIWHERLTYRECLHCQYKDGLTPQEILKQGEGRT